METFAALLALCEGNPQVTGGPPPPPSQRPVTPSFSLIYAWINDWANNRDADDVRVLWRHCNTHMIWSVVHTYRVITGHRWIPRTKPVTESVDGFFHMCLNKRLSKQSWGWWFETPSRSLWRHRNETILISTKFFSWYFRTDDDGSFGVLMRYLWC